ncbi:MULTISPECIES: alkaline phosphatase family protein [unclassified Bradyrhizobium]|uniref:alkaline phosphatase family protein n=1 Tax=unclassified Bradyrhizobium TaxID=2631580 RepID=UPI001BAC8792|nr:MULTISPECIES: alkaline phosphatase family protein [unclassified Bradyrhizobium]MBR1223644.1 alkaline phosphatase family protein [Bradyrhizobium sp. AUGA SZCCT0176]MBR1296249.1 alkaline phosphatase family protein [Bradyrhizobium sp. AUGA SZCCT0042]
MGKLIVCAVFAILSGTLPCNAQQNVILFVADGLRAAAVTPERAPTFARIRDTGVNFSNSHSVYPTITTSNASVIATGHLIGDTGDFGNVFYTGFPVASAAGTITPFIQNNAVLSELNQHHGGNFIAERSIMAAARDKGYFTAALGKVGPVAIHDLTELDGKTTIFFDDDTGKKDGIALRPDLVEMLKKAGLALETPGRAQRENPGKATNIVQQKYYRDVVTKVLLPHFKENKKPFMLLYWSSDPDGTQHSQRDSVNELVPGINGPTSLAAIKVADDDLAAIVAALKELGLEADTNIFITADHGFSTVSKQSKTSPAAKLKYDNVPEGQLPPGFLAIDLAHAVGLPLHEPSAQGAGIDYKAGKYPRRASASIGNDPAKPDIVVGANGGNDLIYLPQDNAKTMVRQVVKALLAQDYTSGVFVRDDLGPIPGTLPLSRVGLKGGARTPTPAIVVNFRSETTGCDQPLFCSVTVSDTTLLQGQGHHGSFSRADTGNFMAAIGPAFKTGFNDTAPVSNADIAPTLEKILGVTLPPVGKLRGRALTEALLGGKPARPWRQDIVSKRGDNGLRTIVNMQFVGSTRYFDAAGFPGRTVGLKVPDSAR